MKALTLTQPWASLVARGVKTIETRSWSTKYRGLLAIHAAASRPALGPVGPYVVRDLAGERVIHGEGTPLVTRSLPLGAVIATCRLVDILPIGGQPTDGRARWVENQRDGLWLYFADTGRCMDVTSQRPFGDFSPGRSAWLLEDIQPTSEPVSVKGALGLWEWAQ